MKLSLVLPFTLLILTLTLAACSSGTSNPAPDLNGTAWTLTTLNGQPVVEGTTPSLSFTDGQASGNGSCNGFGGEYTQDGEKLTFGPLMSTLMACEPQEIMDQETAYFAALAAVASFRMDGGTLYLLDSGGNVLLTFTAYNT